MSEKKFNPFYDSDFLISHEGSDERRMLVELYTEELIQLRSEIDAVLDGRPPYRNTTKIARELAIDRLTKRVGDGVQYNNGEYITTCYPKNNNLTDVDKLAAKLCDLEDKIEQGELTEVRHGHWQSNGRCSCCEAFSASHGSDLCANCGAKMDGERDN